MKNKGSKLKSKKKGSDNVFGCDLIEHLQSSADHVPQVLKKCAEFIEHHGVVDGIYRLSGVTSNIQRLRQEFSSDSCPDLTKEVYLQDIHCVGSLCKLYFRELPNPLLTYELYSQFTEAARIQGPQEKLEHIQRVIKELPVSHFRTLDFLTKHLSHLATLSSQTNMHTRNLALVWAPNLLRSRDMDSSVCSGEQAFQEVRVQQAVVEFILNHTEYIFNHGAGLGKAKEGLSFACGEKYATLPLSGGQCGPMKLMSLEEAQARSLGPDHPVHRERQRENSLPDTSTATLYHTVLDVSDSKRKFSGKSKKWKSIFNLGRSVNDSKGKLSRNGSVFIRGPNTDKAALRPARSMDSLCSLQIDDDRTGSPSSGANGALNPDGKSRTLGSDSLYDLREEDRRWDFKGKTTPAGATGGRSSPATNQREATGGDSPSSSSSSPPPKTLPEQLKVFKGDDLPGFKPTSPKNRRMLYSGSAHHHPGTSKPSFPGSLFPLESSSPRHQRKAVNISEPFAVSVPLRVSAVISSNSTPCGAHVKDKAGAKPPLGEGSSSGSGSSGSSSVSSSLLQLETDGRGKQAGDATSDLSSADPNERQAQDGGEGKGLPKLECSGEHVTASPGKLDEGSSPSVRELWSNLHHELRITEPELDLLDKTFQPIFCPEGSSQSSNEDPKTKYGRGGQSKRSSSSPTLSVFHGVPKAFAVPLTDLLVSFSGPNRVRKQASESDILLPFYQNIDFAVGDKKLNPFPCASRDEKESKPHGASMVKSTSLDTSTGFQHWQLLSGNKSLDFTQANLLEKAVPPVADTGHGRFLEGASQDGVEIETYENHKPSEEVLVETTKTSPEGRQAPLAEVQKAATSSECLVDRPKTSSEGGKELLTEVQKAAKSSNGLVDRPRTSSEGGQKPLAPILRAGISSIRLQDRPKTLVFHHPDEDEACTGHREELDLLESWDELSSGNRQWVTSPLHTPEIEDLFRDHLLLAIPTSFSTLSSVDGVGGVEGGASSLPLNMNEPSPTRNVGTPSGTHVSQSRGTSEEPRAPHFLLSLPRANGSGHAAVSPQATKSAATIKAKNCNGGVNPVSQRLRRQTSQEMCPSAIQKEEGLAPRQVRPCSLNLDLQTGHRCIRDISNRQQGRLFREPIPGSRGGPPPHRLADDELEAPDLEELEHFLSSGHAPLRRNSAPVSVSSVRTAFMIRTSQAKAVPVVPPRVQYTQVPNSRQDTDDIRGLAGEQENQNPKRTNTRVPTPVMPPTTTATTAALKKEEFENKKPVPRHQKHGPSEKPQDTPQEVKNGPTPDPEPRVTLRKPVAAAAPPPTDTDVFLDRPRPDRPNILQRPSFRNRQRPQSLILLSPPFPIMDFPPLDDSKLALSGKRSLNDATSTARREEATAGVILRRAPAEGKGLQSKMTIPKSGQRLETSTSCFYQPQRRSMIFEGRTQRQIE